MILDARVTTDQLLAALRGTTGREQLTWARQPRPLSGGFWAEMYDVELLDPAAELTGRFVARIMPDPDIAETETIIQRKVHRHGLSVPAVYAFAGPGDQLDRAWMLMQHASGRPPLSGFSATNALRQAPAVARRLPPLLADAAAALHRCPPDGLEHELAGRDPRGDIDDFLQRIARQAISINRRDLADTADQLANRTGSTRVICHGDLHPFNILVDADQWTLIDWSAAVMADPHYDLAFTTLMLASPPLAGPAPVRAAARLIGTRLANRFLAAYQQLSDRPINPERLDWGRQVHALRALVELHTWEIQGTADAHASHPWVALRPSFEEQLTMR